MNYLLIFYTGDKILKASLKKGESITAGSGENDTVRINNGGLEIGHVTLRYIDGGINLSALTPFNVMGTDSVNRMLSAGDSVRINNHVMLIVLEASCSFEDIISLDRLKEVTIGRSHKNDICLKSYLVSSSHAVIRRVKNKWVIKDRHSSNGIFVNGRLIAPDKETELDNGAVIFIGGFIIEFRDNALRFRNTAGNVILQPYMINEITTVRSAKKSYPMFYRSPRIRRNPEAKEVEILAPPATGTRPSISWLSVLLPPGMMITIMLSIAAFTKNIHTLIYTMPMSLVSVIMAIVNNNGQKKKWRQVQELAGKKYQEHLTEKLNEITIAETRYISVLSWINPGLHECISIAQRIERRLWERTVKDSDFMNIRLGTGQVLSNVDIKIPREQLVLEENPFLKEAAKLKSRHETLSGVPVCHSFLDSPVTGLVGSHEGVKKMVWAVLINTAVHHSYEDVKIVCVYPEREKEQWEWIRWLPHVWNSEHTRRFMSCTLKDESEGSSTTASSKDKKGRDKTARTMLREFAEILKLRQREANDDRSENHHSAPFYLLVLADKTLAESSGEQFLPQSSSLGFAIIYAYGDIRTLPGECNAIIECPDPGSNSMKAGSVQMTWEDKSSKVFIPDYVNLNLSEADDFARSISPIRVQTAGRSGAIPSKATLFAGLGVRTVEELDILTKWEESKSHESLSVPIGLKGNGDRFYFDIHPKITTTPHGVVAGTSGSGKSETLTAWLLSLATHFSPRDLNILIIEFKGNDLSNILVGLPHIAGVVNNLQASNVIERSLTSLWAEHYRRMRIFESLEDLATKSLPAYQEYQKSHKDKNLQELPFLIIVLDEFAEFKNQFPDQIDTFVRLARVGRSTGLYMVLATQSPSGVVAGQIEANIGYRVCLRTANTGESKEIIGTNDAFFISYPGRAYVKIGDSVYEQVQTFYSKVPYNPNKDKTSKDSEAEVNLVIINGERFRPQDSAENKKADQEALTEGQVLVAHIIDIVEKNHFPKVKQVWTKELPEVLSLSELDNLYNINRVFINNEWSGIINDGFKFAAGLLDIPSQQKQEPFILDFIASGHQLLFGAPSSGKTTFLQTAVISAAMSYTPDQLQILIFDLGSGSMIIFEDLPHTLMVSNAKRLDRLQEAKDYLLSEIDRRSSLLEAQRVSTIGAYNKKTGTNLPFVLVAIDNVTVLNTQFSEIMDVIVKTASEGGGLGIYILATCTGSSMFKLENYIKSKHALELTDPTEYRALVGAASKQKPGAFKGRGFTSGPLEFQTAMCGEDELSAMCLAMNEAWKSHSSRFSLNEASQEAQKGSVKYDVSSVGFTIGINKVSRMPVEFVPSEMGTCVISGSTESNRRNAAGLMINFFTREPDTQVYIYESESEAGAGLSTMYPDCKAVHDIASCNELISELADEFDLRSNDDEKVSYETIAFFIDDFAAFYRKITSESAAILETLTRSGADFRIYVYIISSIEDLAFMDMFRESIKPFDNCIKKGNAIAAGGNIRDYTAFNGLHRETDINFSESEHEGCLIHNGRLTTLKFTWQGD